MHQEIQLQQLSEAVGVLTKGCFACYGADIDTNEIWPFKEIELVHQLMHNVRTVQEAFDCYLPVGVMPEDMAKMRLFTDTTTLSDRMRDTDTLKCIFHGTVPGMEWCRAKWIVLRRDDKGRAYQFLYLTEEISEELKKQKQYEEELWLAKAAAESANAAKTLFLNSISHDIRTPMNGIIGMTAIASSHIDNRERVRECLGKISAASKHLMSLINEVLDVSRIESGRMELTEERFSLTDQISTMLSMIAGQASAKQQELKVVSDKIQHNDVIGDAVRLQQVFMNLVSNAVKYTQEGGCINVTLEELESENAHFAKYRFVCQDNGFGMTQKDLDNLFVPFERSNEERVRRVQGTGLGMVITRNIVTLMDGDILVESDHGKGSTFTVTFSLKKQVSDTVGPNGSNPSGVPATGLGDELKMFDAMDFSDKRILLVEDNELNREIALEIVGMTEAKVESAENGEQALQMFRQSPVGYYDMVLMDIQMPVMDGHQASRAIRDLSRPDARRIPIVAMSANAFVEDKRSSISAGMNEHLAKPINLPKLIQVMTKYLGANQKQHKPKPLVKQNIEPARYYDYIYMTNGAEHITAEMQHACSDVLDKNGAVGIVGWTEQSGFPIYSISRYALTALGYTFAEAMEVTHGLFANLIHPDERSRMSRNLLELGAKHQFRILPKSGNVLWATVYITEGFLADDGWVRIASLHVHRKPRINEMSIDSQSLWKESIIRSVTGSALYIYEFDVTTGLVGKDIIGEDGTNYTRVLNIQSPCFFDDLIRRSHVRNLHSSTRIIDGLTSLCSRNLLKAFEQGDTCPEVEYYYIDDDEYHRITYFMSRNTENDHVLAMAVCRNITHLVQTFQYYQQPPNLFYS